MDTDRHKTWVEIDRAALRHNARSLKSWVGQSRLMAVVKANAYGHGLRETVRSLRGLATVSWFGVDSLDEALAVRQCGGKQPILIMGYVPAGRLKQAVGKGFSLVAYDLKTLGALNEIGSGRKPAKVHLKLETGTSRQGVAQADLSRLANAIRKMTGVTLEGLSTHYADIEDTTDPSYAMGQLAMFQEGRNRLVKAGLSPTICHTAASAAALLYPVTRFDMVRTGLALYGLWPSDNARKVTLASGGPSLRPALTWKTRVAQVKRLSKGTPVSYGLTEKVRRDSRVAVLPVGYWDGFDRKLSSRGQVLVNGHRAKVLGRVCMNMIVVDVTDCGRVKAHDQAVLLGRQGKDEVTAEEMASLAETINYESVARINPQIARFLVY